MFAVDLSPSNMFVLKTVTIDRQTVSSLPKMSTKVEKWVIFHLCWYLRHSSITILFLSSNLSNLCRNPKNV